MAEKRSSSTSSTRPRRVAVVQLRVLGGAAARIPADATAFAHRDKKLLVVAAAMYDRAEEGAEHDAWVASAAAALGDPATGPA